MLKEKSTDDKRRRMLANRATRQQVTDVIGGRGEDSLQIFSGKLIRVINTLRQK